MELSNFTVKVLTEFSEAMASFTPENVMAVAKAKAEALKLTDPEQKKRDECIAIIESVTPKLTALEDAKAENAETLKAIEEAHKAFDEREKSVKESEQKISQANALLEAREKAAAKKEDDLDNYSDQLDEKAKGHRAKEKTLADLEASLNEQAASFEQAQKLIKRK